MNLIFTIHVLLSYWHPVSRLCQASSKLACTWQNITKDILIKLARIEKHFLKKPHKNSKVFYSKCIAHSNEQSMLFTCSICTAAG